MKTGNITQWHGLLVALLVPVLLGTAFGQTNFNEAPQLAQWVAAGELPPVQERLPLNPMVVPVVEEIGEYGGTWRTALVGGGDRAWLARTIDYDNLVRFTPDWEAVIPNIAESVEVNEDATEYTFHLREGMRWSDGHPFTADDIMFWEEDIRMNEEFNPSQGIGYLGGQLEAVEKLDDYTVVFRFAEPHGLFLQRLATPDGAMPTLYPRHYAEQFHPRYNPEGIDALVAASGLDNWMTLIDSRIGWNERWDNTELPRLTAWTVTTGYGEGAATRVVAERNPYYWKVDEEGNQLPYLDRVLFDILGDSEVLLLRALSGEIDMMDRHIATPPNRAVFVDNMERGNYRLFRTIPTAPNYMNIIINLNSRNPVLREVFNNKDFRIGLSHAINRQELIDLIWIGHGEPHQSAPRPESEFYNERLAKQYTEYDVDLANEHLDRAGYAQRDAQGFRLGPDGNRIAFTVEFDANIRTYADALELIQEYWRDVGIDAQIRGIDRALLDIRTKDTGEHDVTVHAIGGGAGQGVILDPRYYFPHHRDATYAPAWRNWFLNSEGEWQTAPEEPPPAMQRQMELYRQLINTGDQDRQAELMHEILEIAADEFWVMGISLEGEGYGIVRNNFRNVPESMPNSWLFPHPGPTNPEQYFIRSGN